MNLLHFTPMNIDPASGGGGAGVVTPTPAASTVAASPTPTPDPFWKGLYGDDGKINKTALDRLPDDLKPAKDWIAKYDSIGALLYGGHNANIVASKKALAPLEANAPDHVRAERKALLDGVNNVPREAKGYGIDRPKDFPEEHWNQSSAEKFGAIAHKWSMAPEAVKELLALQIDATNTELARGKQMEADFFKAQDEAFAAGAQKSGLAADKALDLAKRGAATVGLDPESMAFKNAEVRMAMLKIASLVAEDKLVTGDITAAAKANYREQAQDILNNPANPLNAAWLDSNHPQHERAKATVHKLYRQNGQQTRGEKVEV